MPSQPSVKSDRPLAGTSDVELARLVEKLNSLHEGEVAVGKLIASGKSAIEPLRRFLLGGKPSVVYQPRRWAVEALAGLGAKDVLIEYLERNRALPDAAVRFGEEPVENAAASALADWQTSEVFNILLALSRRRVQLGLVEALGRFQRAEAIPDFIQALEDDVCRGAAEDALRAMGPAAAPALAEAALVRRPSEEEERPSSVLRRASVLQLLSETEVTKECWQSLRELIRDSHPEIAIAISKIAAKVGDRQDKADAVRCLLEVLPSADWFAHGEIETCLLSLYPAGRDMLDREIAKRNALPEPLRVMDRALRTLLRIKRQTDAQQPAT